MHLYGQHADLDPLIEACDEYGVTLVEDAAESLGSTYKGRQTATTAPFSILSFNGNKIITTTGGGMCVSKDAAAAPVFKKWATQSKEAKIEYEHTELGYNYRMSNVLAGIGRGQLEVLDDRVQQRQRVAARYAEAFADLPGVTLQNEAPWGMHTRWLSVIHIDPEMHDVRPADVVRSLEELNIETRPVWRPMHTQPLLQGATVIGGVRLGTTLRARTLSPVVVESYGDGPGSGDRGVPEVFRGRSGDEYPVKYGIVASPGALMPLRPSNAPAVRARMLMSRLNDA